MKTLKEKEKALLLGNDGGLDIQAEKRPLIFIVSIIDMGLV
jgi:hypothetical protein